MLQHTARMASELQAPLVTQGQRANHRGNTMFIVVLEALLPLFRHSGGSKGAAANLDELVAVCLATDQQQTNFLAPTLQVRMSPLPSY